VTPSASAFRWWSGGTDELNYHTTLKRMKLAKCNILHNRWKPIGTDSNHCNKEQCRLASANGSMVETQEAIGYNKN
jgi:hypothetical protein